MTKEEKNKKKKGKRAKEIEKHRFARAERMRPSRDRVVEVANTLEGMFFHLESGLLLRAIEIIRESDLNKAIFNIVKWEKENLRGKGVRKALDIPDGDVRYSEIWIARLEDTLEHVDALIEALTDRGNYKSSIEYDNVDVGDCKCERYFDKHIRPVVEEIKLARIKREQCRKQTKK